jgi:hypothetical protein
MSQLALSIALTPRPNLAQPAHSRTRFHAFAVVDLPAVSG